MGLEEMHRMAPQQAMSKVHRIQEAPQESGLKKTHIKPAQQEVQGIDRAGLRVGKGEDVQINPSDGNEKDMHNSITEWALEKMHRTATGDT